MRARSNSSLYSRSTLLSFSEHFLYLCIYKSPEKEYARSDQILPSVARRFMYNLLPFIPLLTVELLHTFPSSD